ncbi:hypothetical protein CEXT_245931 [Caerostris extrusa]|uniref:Secreted protein n=1 Tax=Caerostris extrusa TaxID=172846 RepID=A0AAV4NGT6_CAEEX|nr:hypothetical protein CEXT_245931 [Caerostris extrusa]
MMRMFLMMINMCMSMVMMTMMMMTMVMMLMMVALAWCPCSKSMMISYIVDLPVNALVVSKTVASPGHDRGHLHVHVYVEIHGGPLCHTQTCKVEDDGDGAVNWKFSKSGSTLFI